MKFIHTSDWHLGHSLYNYDRQEEQEDMLRQIVKIVSNEQPDIFLLCGDIYHTAQPPAATQRLFADTIADLHLACPEMKIFITAGNHDSASRHDIFNRPWRALNVTTVGAVDAGDLDSMIFEVPGKCYVIAVPYCHERNMPDDLFIKLTDRTAELNKDRLPVIMTAHTAVTGSDFKGHDQTTEINVGGIDCMAIRDFGEGGEKYDYLALGHIHRAQTLRGSCGRIRYSGTPLPVSFDEDYPHSISMVELSECGEEPIIREIPISNCHPLITLPSEGYASFEETLELLKGFPDDIEAYIRLNVEITDFLPHMTRENAEAATRDKKCRFCHINVVRKTAVENNEQLCNMSVGEFKELSPLEIAGMFAEEKGGILDNELKELLSEIYISVKEEERE